MFHILICRPRTRPGARGHPLRPLPLVAADLPDPNAEPCPPGNPPTLNGLFWRRRAEPGLEENHLHRHQSFYCRMHNCILSGEQAPDCTASYSHYPHHHRHRYSIISRRPLILNRRLPGIDHQSSEQSLLQQIRKHSGYTLLLTSCFD